ncbi:hypothetical protein IMG5_185030 [Ichthyophthirius multifiliis]|uniref:EF-hand domain-containing protein n=1 Tax=Ichthyophthirius multifiliis TaxID=5932 RepID=G0R3F0_ICHMU|nr:hypothetical protein IMG5_185030 [Ichthyophthirius multifiliis]EGR28001.1 hypothetical protein IMG5_185030 [Ichthyophthirius multifiliis]|eukprot:XP_004027346.1 hypothetical protein IMG5_185030 [Ichthyophthirius multifiliis]
MQIKTNIINSEIENAKFVARRIFENYDKGKKGYLELQDLDPMVKDAYQSFHIDYYGQNNHIETYKSVLDTNNDGRVTYQDIENLCLKYLCGIEHDQEEKARRLFNKYDIDKGGFLEQNEIILLIKDTYNEMKLTNYQPTQEDLRVWLLMADSNTDGRISLEEYENIVIKSLRNAGIKIEQQKMVF